MAAETLDSAIEEVIKVATHYENHPIPGQPFLDVFPIFRSPALTDAVISNLTDHIRATHDVDSIAALVCLEARGFIFAPLIAARLGIPVVPVRKKGKLPGSVVSISYEKEYGPDIFEMKTDAFDGIRPGAVIIVDDLIATGGSVAAAKELVSKFDRAVAECVFIVHCPQLHDSVEKVMQGTPIYGMVGLTAEVIARLPRGR